MEVFIHPQKRLLVDVMGVFGRSKQVEGKPQNVLIVQTHQLLKRVLVAPLSRPNQLGFVHSNGRLGHCCLQHLNRRKDTEKVTATVTGAA